MKRTVIALALVLQLGMVAATAPPVAAAPQVAEEFGAGWGDALMCAGCVVGGIIFFNAVGAAGAVAIAVVGGAEAAAGAVAVAACVSACYSAFAE